VPRQRKTIDQWLEARGDDLGFIRLRVGDRRNPETVAWIALDAHAAAARKRTKDSDHAVITVRDVAELRDQVLDLADGAGWPDEDGCHSIRIHAHDPKGMELPSYTRTVKPSQPSAAGDGAAAAAVMADALVRAMDRQGRTIETLTRTIEHREGLTIEAMDAVIEAGQRQLDAEAEALDAGIRAHLAGELAQADEQANQIPDEIRGLIGAAAKHLPQALAAGGGGLDLGELRDVPDEVLDHLVQDEALVSRVLAAYQRSKAPPAKGGNDEG